MRRYEIGLMLVIAVTSTFMPAIAPAYAEAPPVVQPQNVAEWNRFVSARLQRRSGTVVNAGRKLGIVGKYTVKIGFSVMPDGSVSDVHVVQGSGDERLDAAALNIPASAVPFPAFTSGMAPTPRSMVAPLIFQLRPASPEPKTP